MMKLGVQEKPMMREVSFKKRFIYKGVLIQKV